VVTGREDFLNNKKFDVKKYWETRYYNGGNSGRGSYGSFREFKLSVINQFIKENNIGSLVDIGCGDGSIAEGIVVPGYTGLDISASAVEKCRTRIKNTGRLCKHFYTLDDIPEAVKDKKFHISMSIDVLYHLVDDKLFEEHMKILFGLASEWVIIYSPDKEHLSGTVEHIKHRIFTKYISDNYPEWVLERVIKNTCRLLEDVPRDSFADFFIYRHNNLLIEG
jgi:hypothetical protein